MGPASIRPGRGDGRGAWRLGAVQSQGCWRGWRQGWRAWVAEGTRRSHGCGPWARPTIGQGRAGEARFRSLVKQPAAREDNAGTGARRLAREGEALGVFRAVPGGSAAEPRGARPPRRGVWRKRWQGPDSEQGQRVVERGLAWRHRGRSRGRPTLPRLVAAVSWLLNGARLDRNWSMQHEALLVPSTPGSGTMTKIQQFVQEHDHG